MRKAIIVILASTALLVAAAAEVSAQDVLMNSAETINQGNFKLALFPTVLLGKNGGDPLWGLAGRFGYGFTPRFDIEAKARELQRTHLFRRRCRVLAPPRRECQCFGRAGRSHDECERGRGQLRHRYLAPDQRQAQAGKLELYGGLKLAFDSVKNSDQNFTLAHFVPGFEYAINSDLDFLAEFGIGLNDNSRSYVSVGLALYLR